ncbi:hypothetical protein FQA39_LY06837 [Lamprigera yunnana]|nr:hypothetical protein FQA39_LY06837 [Lamprigera yunnana]
MIIKQYINHTKCLISNYKSVCVQSYVTSSENHKMTERIKRQEPGPKTGVSGLGTLCFTISAGLISKELYVLEHDFYGGLSLMLLTIIATKKLGPDFAKFLDKKVDEYEMSLNNTQELHKKHFEDLIKHENKLQQSIEGQLMIIDVKRENIALQREAAYRERRMYAYRQTLKRLEYCVTREAIEKAIAKRCMTDWVVEQVRAAITKEIEESSITKCMQDLEYLGKQYEKLATPYPDSLIVIDEIETQLKNVTTKNSKDKKNKN